MSRSIAKKRPYRVRNSTIHGRGVFAATTILKGTQIIEYRGQRTTWEVVSVRPDSNPDHPEHTFIFETSDGTVIGTFVTSAAVQNIVYSAGNVTAGERYQVYTGGTAGGGSTGGLAGSGKLAGATSVATVTAGETPAGGRGGRPGR